MNLTIVVATDSVANEPSKQFTTVPFRSVLTGLIIILDINGMLPSSESLDVFNVELLITAVRPGPVDVMGVNGKVMV
jgi:hypothetical protein